MNIISINNYHNDSYYFLFLFNFRFYSIWIILFRFQVKFIPNSVQTFDIYSTGYNHCNFFKRKTQNQINFNAPISCLFFLQPCMNNWISYFVFYSLSANWFVFPTLLLSCFQLFWYEKYIHCTKIFRISLTNTKT